MVNKKRGIVVFIFFLLAIVGVYLILVKFNFYKSDDVNTSVTSESERAKVLSLVKSGKPLSESDKKLIFGIIKGDKINNFNFSPEEFDLIMKALNK